MLNRMCHALPALRCKNPFKL